MEKKLETHENISLHLKRLKKWQEDQQKILNERQNAQREMLGLEHQKMYQLLGISSNTNDSANVQIELVSNLQSKMLSHISTYSRNNDNVQYLNANDSTDCKNDVEVIASKKPFLKRGQGLTNRFKIHPDSLRLINLPKYKFANVHKGKFNVVPKAKKYENFSKEVIKSTSTPNQLKLVQSVQQELFNKDNLNEKSNYTDQSKTNIIIPNDSSLIVEDEIQIEPIPWARILDPHSIKPKTILNKNNFDNSTLNEDSNYDDTGNLSIFELLEQKASEGSFDLNNSRIKRWIKSKAKLQVENSSVDDAIPIDAIQKTIGNKPLKDTVINSSDSSNDYNDDDDETIKNREYRPELHVRFSDKIVINEIDSETDTVCSADVDVESSNTNISKTSTPNEKIPFEKFKAQLFGNSDGTINTSKFDETNMKTLSDEHFAAKKQEIIDRTNVLKTRLVDLESEITTFKNNNLELIRLKQEHELEKANFEKEKHELYEEINDEKINLEIYLHDERIKIEQEKTKIQKILRDQRNPNRKEREEISKLKEEVEKLLKDIKNKEADHVSAQSRLRAQIRNHDKDMKELNSEIDRLKKENKKLENENLRLNRDSNNKMLHEINRNIAKLTPKLSEALVPIVEVHNSNPKRVQAHVIVHKKPRKLKGKLSTFNKNNKSISSSDKDDSESFKVTQRSSSDEEELSFQKSLIESNFLNKLNKSSEPVNSLDSSKDQFKREIQNSDGSKDIWYPNGNLKKISADGMIIRMLYFNKDIKETNINEGTVKYYYSETNTWHTTYLDGLEILEFPNGQTEHRYKDGIIEVHFPNGSIRITNPIDDEKTEEWRYPDGTNLIQMKNGDKILTLANGQKEIHTKLHKRREYPDGTVKLVYPDGSQETRYSNGRVRLKDKDGNLVMDSINNKY